MTELESELTRALPRLKTVAPRGFAVEEVIQNVVWTVQRDERLSRCSVRSIVNATIEAVAMGLDPSGLSGDGVLVPRRAARDSRVYLATFVPEYRALIRLALSHPRVSHVEARVVRAGDTFNLRFGDPDGQVVEHKPNIGPDAGEPIGAYAIIWFRDTFRPLVEWMMKAEIDLNAERGAAAKSEHSPWETDWAEMARKTVIKRVLKYFPLGADPSAAGRAGEQQVEVWTASDVPRPSPAFDFRGAIASADAEGIENVIRQIRDSELPPAEKSELFNLAANRKKELRGIKNVGSHPTDR